MVCRELSARQLDAIARNVPRGYNPNLALARKRIRI